MTTTELNDAPAPKRWSLWAIAGLIVSALLVPPMCVIGPLLGLIGVVQTKPGSVYRGRRIALAAILLGTALSAAWIAGGLWWHANVRVPLLHGPRDALAAGMAGDVAGFCAAFGAGSDEVEAAAFLGALNRRYGSLLSVQQDPDADVAPGLDRGGVTLPYLARFEGAAVPMEARFALRDPASGAFLGRWEWIRVVDADVGDLVYPEAAAPEEPTDAAHAP